MIKSERKRLSQKDYKKSDYVALLTATLFTKNVIVTRMLDSGCFGMKQGRQD